MGSNPTLSATHRKDQWIGTVARGTRVDLWHVVVRLKKSGAESLGVSVLQGMFMACPDGWRDKSMLILSAAAPGQSGVTPNMVVTRDIIPKGLPEDEQARMNALIDRQVAQMAEQLAGFAEISRRVSARSEGAMAEVKVDWRNAQAQLTQTITFVQDGPGALVIATATAGRDEFAEAEPTFREMLKSFRIEG